MSHCSRFLMLKMGGWLALGWPIPAGAETEQPPAWDQFRGPDGSGVAPEAYRPPIEAGPSNEVWRTGIPAGLSSPVVIGEHLFLTGVEGDRLVTIAIDRETGNLAWKQIAPAAVTEVVHASGSPAAATPFADQDHVYVYFGSFGLLCYDHEGTERWRRPLPTPKSLYGMSSSPIGVGPNVVLVLDDDRKLPDSELSRSRLLALDRVTGETAWETPRPFHRSGWSTPIVWKHEDAADLVVLGNGKLHAYDPASGQGRWWVTGFSREPIAVPVTGRNRLFVSCARRGGDGDIETDPTPFWEALLPFDTNEDGRIERSEMTGDFTFPFRPELPVGHPGFGMPLPKAPAARKGRIDQMLTWFDRDSDRAWSEEEFSLGFRKKQGKPLLLSVRPGGRGDVTSSHVEWEVNRGIPEIPSPLYHDGLLYLVRAGGILSVLDAESGDPLYRERLDAPGQYAASPVLAGDSLYLASSLGTLTVVRTGASFERVHQIELGEAIEATPAMDENTLYLRTERHLIAFRRPAP